MCGSHVFVDWNKELLGLNIIMTKDFRAFLTITVGSGLSLVNPKCLCYEEVMWAVVSGRGEFLFSSSSFLSRETIFSCVCVQSGFYDVSSKPLARREQLKHRRAREREKERERERDLQGRPEKGGQLLSSVSWSSSPISA